MNYHIHIIDDEETLLVSLKSFFSQKGYQVTTSNSGGKALRKIKKEPPDLVFLDLKLPDLTGLEVLKKIKVISPEIVVIMMTAYSTVETAVKAMKLGAENYIHKPFDQEELAITTKRSLENLKLKRTILRNAILLREDLKLLPIICVSKKMKEIYEQAKIIGKESNSTMLLTGESGTGKEVLAKMVHLESNRANQPFVVVNCSSIPHELVESELFGYVGGAFTGASKHGKIGKFEIADGGTLFLDEIGELKKFTQAKLLRFLQEKEFEKIGSPKNIKVDVRIISATNQNLPKLILGKRFREDLYYRLNVINLHIPPLREHTEDIIPLAYQFIKEFNLEFRKKVKRISSQTKKALESYFWPGNIRQLRNAIERAVLLSKEEELRFDPSEFEVSMELKKAQPFFGVDQPQSLKKIENLYIRKILQSTSGNKSQAAEILGISRSTLRRKYKIN